VARVVAYVPDLLFGSRVLADLQHAGHDAVLAADVGYSAMCAADVLVVDLTSDAAARVERVCSVRGAGLRVLGFYSHVEADVRALAEQSGFDLVVPRSRISREGAGALVDRLLESAPGE
jgi:hypothetical protein